MQGNPGFIGVTGLERGELQQLKDDGEKMSITGTGILVIPSRLDDLVMETVEEIRVRGWAWCSSRVREAYHLS